MVTKKKIKGYAVMLITKDVSFIPDFSSKNIENVYHICSDKKSADKCVKAMKDINWKVVPVEISYQFPF